MNGNGGQASGSRSSRTNPSERPQTTCAASLRWCTPCATVTECQSRTGCGSTDGPSRSRGRASCRRRALRGIARSRRHQQPAPGTMSGSARTSFLTRRPRPRPVGTPTASMHRAMPRRGRPRGQDATSRRARSRGYRPLKSAGPLDRLWLVSAYGDIKTPHTALTRIPKARRDVDSIRA